MKEVNELLSETEKKYLDGSYTPTDRYKSTLNTRIRKKAVNELEDMFLICRNKERIIPKTNNVKNWDDVKTFCDTTNVK